MTDIPLVMTAAGAQPTSPADLRAALIALVAATNPGYTADLPGSLIEDIASTDTGALTLVDQARVELVNSLTPYGANAFLLNQLGSIYGVTQDPATTTSVFVVFTGTPGFPIAKGFVVSDGTHQYTVQDGGIIATGGTSAPLFCLAVDSGSWAVAANTVTTLVTSVPSTITLSVNNPSAGTPAADAETLESYRARVLQAGTAAAQGMATFLKTQLTQVSGVQPRLVSVRQATSGNWEVICGGGDPYEVAYAIYQGLFDIVNLTGSEMTVTGITQANPGVVTTELNHGLTSGTVATIADAVPTNYNGSYTITVLDEKSFSIGVDTTGFPAYSSGGVVTPNPRNVAVTIQDFPDTYVVPYVNPPQQTVTATITWNTTATNFVSEAAVAQLGAPAVAGYLNGLFVGQPINLLELQEVFKEAITSVLPGYLLTRLVVQVDINGISTAPVSGTQIIEGDPESYFFTDTTGSGITVVQG